MRNAAKFTLLTAANSADKNLAARIAISAYLLAQTSTTTSTSTFWHAGITAARCLMAAGDVDGAQNIYQQLSLPQWTDTDRAVAYLDWQYQLKQAGQDQAAADVQQKLEDLGLNNPQMQSVEWSWHTLD
jgi:thioredoxin-like negative regulator of GroEL